MLPDIHPPWFNLEPKGPVKPRATGIASVRKNKSRNCVLKKRFEPG
jgi:hypothetical protein